MIEVNGLDMIDVLSAIKRRQGRYLALLLKDLEEILDTDSDEYKLTRKLVLDHFNDYTRSIFRILIGDEIEGLTFR